MNPNHCIPQGMTNKEREDLKNFATHCDRKGDTQSLTRTLVMVAHWMRQGQRIAFTEYASQWVNAQKDRTDGNHSTPAMMEQWPFAGKKCIGPEKSIYEPRGCTREPVDDETEIRHAVVIILAEYPCFNQHGLALHHTETAWVHPLNTPVFMRAAKSCLAWLKRSDLLHSQIKTFPDDNMTSYGLKHHVERVNGRNCDETGRPGEPTYIPNGAMIAAMVAAGYDIKPATRLNAAFNISKKDLSKAIGKG